jgi:hypothetical protein
MRNIPTVFALVLSFSLVASGQTTITGRLVGRDLVPL